MMTPLSCRSRRFWMAMERSRPQPLWYGIEAEMPQELRGKTPMQKKDDYL